MSTYEITFEEGFYVVNGLKFGTYKQANNYISDNKPSIKVEVKVPKSKKKIKK